MAKLKYYLDTRYKLQDGTYPIRLRISVRSSGAYMSTDIKLKEANWDAVKQQAKGLPNKDKINSFLRSFMVEVDNALLDMKIQGKAKGLSAIQLRDALNAAINGIEKQKTLFAEYFISYAKSKTNKTTCGMYLFSLNVIRQYEPKLDRLTLDDITESWLNNLIRKMDESKRAKNSQSIYLSHIKAVMNEARYNKLTSQEPFSRIKIIREKTVKRNLELDELRHLFNFIPKDKKNIMLFDCFKLIFFLIGVNVADLYELMPDNYVDGRLNFSRHKTHKLYSIKVEPEALEIINKYRGKKRLLSYADTTNSKNAFTTKLNNALKEADQKLSSYFARYTWATIAHEIGIDKDTISLSLGHAFGVSVTDTYIDYNAEKVDEANRKVIDWVLYNKR